MWRSGTGRVPPPPPLHRNQNRQCLQHAGGSWSPTATHVLLRGIVYHLLVRVGTAHCTGGEAWPPVTFADDGAPAPCAHHFSARAALSAACHQFANRINLCAGDDVERSGLHHRRYAVPFPGPNPLPLRHRLAQRLLGPHTQPCHLVMIFRRSAPARPTMGRPIRDARLDRYRRVPALLRIRVVRLPLTMGRPRGLTRRMRPVWARRGRFAGTASGFRTTSTTNALVVQEASNALPV